MARLRVSVHLALLCLFLVWVQPARSVRAADEHSLAPTVFFMAYHWPQTEGQDPREILYAAPDPAAPSAVMPVPTGEVPGVSPDGGLAILTSVTDLDISVVAFDTSTSKQSGALSLDRGLAGTADGTLVASPARWLADGSAFVVGLSWRSEKGGPVTWLQVDRALTVMQVIGHVDGPASGPGTSSDGQWATYNELVSPGWQLRLLQFGAARGLPLTVLSSQYERSASWNADDSRMAFLSELPGTVYVIDVASGKATAVASFTTSSTGRWSVPVWSPDGTHLAFLDALPSANPVGPFDRLLARLFILNLETGEREQIALPPDMQADNPIVWKSRGEQRP